MIDELDFTKMKSFCSAYDIVSRIIGQVRDQVKVFAKGTSDKEVLSKIYKELLKLNSKKAIQFKRWVKNLNRCVTKEDIQLANKYMERS